MKILITGATGFIGSKLVKLLLEKNHTIYYLSTSKNKIRNRINYKGFFWNPATQEIDVNCFEGVETIIHLAGATIAKRWTSSYKNELLSSRIQSSDLLFETLPTSHSKSNVSFCKYQ